MPLGRRTHPLIKYVAHERAEDACYTASSLGVSDQYRTMLITSKRRSKVVYVNVYAEFAV